MRVDEITKDVMTTWPLTTVKRWAASPYSFTLDFGDYHDSFYSVQTSEGETISQLIAGYLDIILKKKKASEKFIHDVDDEVTMIEDNIEPQRAAQMQLIDQVMWHSFNTHWTMDIDYHALWTMDICLSCTLDYGDTALISNGCIIFCII